MQNKAKACHRKMQEWEKGDDFTNGKLKSKAITTIVGALEKCTVKLVTKATLVLSGVVSSLAKCKAIDESAILTEHLKEKMIRMNAMFENARA